MSSHMLLKEEFQLIADWLFEKAKSKHLGHYVKEFLGYDVHEKEFVELPNLEINVHYLVKKMYDLNRLALVVRYSDHYDRDEPTQFKPKFNPYASTKDTIRTLKSLLYQCSEYLVMETEFYKQIKDFIGEICVKLYLEE